MSGEIQSDIADDYFAARRRVEALVNRHLQASDYGAGISTWAVIAIILRDERGEYPEITKYMRAKRDLEIRLQIRHAEFKSSPPPLQKRMVWEMLLRSCSLMPGLGVRDFDSESLLADLTALCEASTTEHPIL